MAAPVAPLVAKAAVSQLGSKGGSKLIAALVVMLLSIVFIPVIMLTGLLSVVAAGAASLETEMTEGGGYDAAYQPGTCAPNCPGVDGPDAGMSVKAAISLALSEVGTSRPTGYDGQGECMVSVRRWVNSAGGYQGGGGSPLLTFQNSRAVQVFDGSLRPGDVVQYLNIANPHSWGGYGYGVHTYMVIKVHPDGTHDLVESNVPAGSGRVGVRLNQHFTPPPGWYASVWRFAKTVDI